MLLHEERRILYFLQTGPNFDGNARAPFTERWELIQLKYQPPGLGRAMINPAPTSNRVKVSIQTVPFLLFPLLDGDPLLMESAVSASVLHRSIERCVASNASSARISRI
jgi:hypothetical protein